MAMMGSGSGPPGGLAQDYADLIPLLKSHVQDSNDQLALPRRNRRNILREMVGMHQFPGGTDDRRPVNLIEMFSTTFVRANISRAPAVRVSTSIAPLKTLANSLSLAQNVVMKRMDIERTWASAVAASMVGLGVTYYGLGTSGDTIQIGDDKFAVARPIARNITLDDFIIDMNATSFEPECLDFIGHYSVMPIRNILNNPYFDQEMAALLRPMRGMARDRDHGGEERADSIAHGQGSWRVVRDKVELITLAIPSEGIVMICDAALSLPRPLKIRRHYGPGTHPYELLGFTEVDGNLLPLAPLTNLQDLHLMVNELFNKASRDALAEKTLLYAQASAKRDADTVTNAANGSTVIGMNPPEMLKEVHFRGANPNTIATLMQGKMLFNSQAGNIEALAGLGPQSDTLGQDRMIVASASQKLEDMKKASMKAFKAGCERIGYYLFTDPYLEVPITFRLDKFKDFEATDVLRAEDIRGDFIDFNFDIVPFSQIDMTPRQKLQSVLEIFQTIAQFIPMAAQQGEIFQVGEFMRSIAELANVEDVVGGWFLSGEPQTEAIGTLPAKVGGGKGGEYIHRNVSGTSPQGQDVRQIQALLSAGASNDGGGMMGAA